MNCPPFFLYLFDDLPFAIYFGHLPCWQFFELLPFFVHRGFRIWNFHRLEHENELEHKIAVTQRVEPPSPQYDLCDLLIESLQTLSRGLVSFYDACVLWCLDFVGSAFDFSMLVRTLRRLQLTRHGSFCWKFQLFPRVLMVSPHLILSSGQIN